jgi:hypothetical protein
MAARSANILYFKIAQSKFGIDKLGEESWDKMLTLSSITMVGINGEADDVGDVVFE